MASWLSLEDYFFVGDKGAIEVATSNGHVAAKCLPPLLTGSGPLPLFWNSETDLFMNVTQRQSLRNAILMFQAFRVAYLDLDDELQQIAQQGIQHVRVPMSWCLTDFDPSQDELLVVDQPTTDDDNNKLSREQQDHLNALLMERYVCIDPYFDKQQQDQVEGGATVYWPAVPKPLIVQLLRACHKYNIKATLDIHTYMGGTSLGTFSGVWPRHPLFWLYDQAEAKYDAGRRQFQSFIEWVESLSESDPDAFAGIGGITPMNEPAHLAGLFGPGSANPDQQGFVPWLPRDVAGQYIADLQEQSVSQVPIPDGAHLRVLLWQSDAVNTFRQSSLPDKGVNIVVNVHESIFARSLVEGDADLSAAATHPRATDILASWWQSITTEQERSSWAVLDMHHYHAWEPACQGATDGSGSYVCGNEQQTDEVLQKCAGWAGVFRSSFVELGGKLPRPKLYSGEFSASTFHSVLHSCMDLTTLRKSYLAQLEAGNAAGVDLFWWSWKMPYGGAFRPAWSFKHLMYLLGQEGFDHPDESDIPCDA